MNTAQQNFQIQKRLTVIILLLFIIKVVAWYLTNSVAILTDALEYTINVVSGFIGLYSLYISAKPKDKNHPYGHGKVEFLSATVEGTLMIVSCFVIIYEAINNLKHPHQLLKLDFGIYLIALSGIINYIVGYYSIKNGKQNNSLALIATGKHLQSDTYATLGLVIGLILIYFTHYAWIDSAVAFIFAIIIIISGYKILRTSIAGIMDEADDDLLEKLIALLQQNRTENWVDLHNLRIIKYGGTLHLDCHLTIPWYFNIHEGHNEVDALDKIVKDNFGNSLELFVHTDGCLDFSCKICSKQNCAQRKSNTVQTVTWTVDNVSSNEKHRVIEN
ncbi:cation diffusion facilitator family transporter [Dolichospermum sp. ST_con]|jgi:cation diffusion facilitator family transporter|nr:cation diffusion facilitator family transporter [Dolichospermum sp. ST_con]